MLVCLGVSEVVYCERANVHRENSPHAQQVDIEWYGDGRITDAQHEVVQLVSDGGMIWGKGGVDLATVYLAIGKECAVWERSWLLLLVGG